MADQTVTQEQTVRLAPFQEDYLADIFASAKALTSEGSQMPYAAQKQADLSSGQQSAITQAQQGVGAYQPYLQQGSQAIGQGIGAVGTGLGALSSAIGQLPAAQQGYLSQQQAMLDAQALGQAGTQQAQAMTAGADFNFDPTSYQQYMDPFMNDVIQQQYQDIARQGDMQRGQLGANAVASGAFGGSRQAVAEQELNRNVMDQQARTGSQLRSQGFQQAQSTAMQAAQQQAAQQLRQAQLTGQLGSTAGALGQTMGQLGTATAGIGQLGQQMGVQDINSLMGVGALQQGQDQKAFDVARQNSLAEQALPYQQVGFMSDLFRGVPALQQTYSTSTAPPPSTQSQLYGLGIAGLGAYGASGGFKNQ